MVLSILAQSRWGLLLNQVTYADNVFLTLSKLDSIADATPIGPNQVNTTGLQFRVDSPTENLVYNGLTLYVANQSNGGCTSANDISSVISQVWLYQSGILLGNSAQAMDSSVGVCAFEIPFTTTLASGYHDFDVMFDTTWVAFNPDWGLISFLVDNTSFSWLQTDTGTGVVPGDITNSANGADFVTMNPGISGVVLLNEVPTQVAYNNGVLTGMSVEITSRSIWDITLSWLTVLQIGELKKFGSGRTDIPHTISLIDTIWTVLATGTADPVDQHIRFENFSYLVPAGQTGNLHIMVSYTGNAVGNGYKFATSNRDVYDTNGNNYPYLVDTPGNVINIWPNGATIISNLRTPASNSANDVIQWLHLGEMRITTSTPWLVQELSLLNLDDWFLASNVTTGTLWCTEINGCSAISLDGDGLTVYLEHESSVIGSGIIVSGAVDIILNTPVSTYDDGDIIDIYVHDPDGINDPSETNKVVRLWLLETQQDLTLSWSPIETQIVDAGNSDLMPSNFDNIIYHKHRIRKSALGITLTETMTGTDSLLTIMDQPWATLLSLTGQSTTNQSKLYQLVFNHTSSGAIASNFSLAINGIGLWGDVDCVPVGWLITCTMTGSYLDGLTIDTAGTHIELIGDVTGSTGAADFISTSLVWGTPTDYTMYDVAGIPWGSTIIRSDESDSTLSQASINRFTDAGVDLDGIEWNFIMGEAWTGGWNNEIIITGFTGTKNPLNFNTYTFSWDDLTGDVRVRLDKDNLTVSGLFFSTILDANTNSWWAPNAFNISGDYHIKVTPIDLSEAPLGSGSDIYFTHIVGPRPSITLYGSGIITMQAGDPYVELGAEWTDTEEGTGLVSMINSTAVNTSATGSYSVTYNYEDSAGNTGDQVIRTVTVIDTTPPVITISGDVTMIVPLWSVYTDQWATYTDNLDAGGDATASWSVNTAIANTYYIDYNHTDASGNTGVTQTRIVTVADNQWPVVTLSWGSDISILRYTDFTDPGATWTDNVDISGILTGATSGVVLTGVLGTYTLEYTHIDVAGNTGNTEIRTVHVIPWNTPTILLNGSGSIDREIFTPYTDLGATYDDVEDGTGDVVTISGSVNTWALWTYTIEYEYTDSQDNIGTGVRFVTIVDTTTPTITINGATGITIPYGWAYTESGAEYSDNVDGTGSALQSWTIDTNIIGTQIIEYYYVDAAGNTGSDIRTVWVTDPDAPIVTIVGDIALTIQAGTSYTDSGATWTDLADGTGSDYIGIWWATWSFAVSGTANTAQLGVYPLQYQKVDNAGNSHIQTRTVTVIDTTPPVITIIGGASLTIAHWSVYSDAWASWSDNLDTPWGPLNGGWLVNTSLTWSYTITYSHTDNAGNTSNASRIVTVTDQAAPIITVIWGTGITIEAGITYLDSWAERFDAAEWTGSLTASGTVNTNQTGTYLLSYDHTDGAGNIAAQATRTVIVEDTTAPVITVIGATGITLTVGDSYSESWATWTDLTNSWSALISGSVNTGVQWVYTIYYSHTDPSGNTAFKTRTITVIDQWAPIITLSWSVNLLFEASNNYVDAGALWADDADGSGSSLTWIRWTAGSFAISGTITPSVPGVYHVQYLKVDTAGNNSIITTRTIIVQDTTAPSITINWPSTTTVAQGLVYTESGAIYSDIVDGTGVALISGSVDTNIIGTYMIEYYKVDTAGNTGTATRTVNVVDLDAPVITLIGSGIITIAQWSGYIESGATRTDNVDGSGFIATPFSGIVMTWIAGNYTLQYRFTDSGGNTSAIVSRIVNVVAPLWSQPIKRTGWWGGSSSRPITITPPSTGSQNSGDIVHGAAPIKTTTGDKATAPTKPTSQPKTGTWSDRVVSIQIGEDGRIIVVKPWDRPSWTDGRIFAKDLDKMWVISTWSTSGTWDKSDKPIILKKYWVITPEMLEDPTAFEDYQPTWDAAPRASNRTLDPRLQSRSRDRSTTQETSSSFYQKIIVTLKTIF
jgi:Domain of unknown function (DUF5011)